ncbi:hypothetical protein BAUCODRAFT_147357 [Baudoinia panamericana UAMH 10762]|uniref:Rhodopsin domain-containing protein n=1 Tax=Baudoinia panamericana (strain UAMH 10762) TaxID=717646 RepID=M2NDB4_BAUPA|nr:uncharacterized protein BAUCODRAFT_147357 [Baudoinia panamericana UAMH 10762]EMC97209.1 hypothetical protein BAUCODRAFT_147357 [Baudoinia panamericana UAMH 10762]
MEDNHEDLQGRSKAVLAVSIVMVALASIFVFLRLISRAAIVKRISVDDYFILLAWTLAFGLTFTICYSAHWGLGRHESDVPLAWQLTTRKANYAFEVLYQPALMALKTSILSFYLSFSKTHSIFKWACIATLFAVNAGGLALTLLTVFQCRPVGAVFRTMISDSATCTNIVTIYLSSAPLNLITDFALLFLPLPILTKMRLPKKQKVILIVTFSFGIFVTAVDVVRIAYLQSAAMDRLANIQDQSDSGDSYEDPNQTDFSYYASLSFMWSVIEVTVGIMVACVPGLKPLISRFLPHMLRDPEDAPSRAGTVSSANGTADMAIVHRIPSMPDDVYQRDFGSQSYAPDEGPMGMIDFLTTPDMNELPSHLQRTQTAQTNTSRNTRPGTPTVFDFVNMSGQKSMVQLTNRESLFPIAAVTVMFFIWGFEYGLLDVLNQQFQRVAHMTPSQSTAIHSAYYAAYFVGPLTVGRLVLKYWGFKACYSVGLGIFACGTLIYWPAAVLTSFPAFLLSNFIVAFGLSILEVSANPFTALCGPSAYAEIRLNLSQGVQAIGSVVAPLIANKAFFQKSFDASSLVNTQWAYLGIALATILLAVGYHYIPLPEATDTELEDTAERMDGAYRAKVGTVNIVYITLAFGVFSQFCYVGGQEVNATSFDAYMVAANPTYNVANYTAVAHTAFAVSRFVAAGLGFWVKPRLLLLACFVGVIVFDVLAMNFSGNTGTAMIIMAFFFEGPIFSLIFAQCLRGMGRHTKLASVFITSAISGGAVFAPISNHLAYNNRGAMYSLVIAVAAFAGASTFAVGLNGNAKARAQVDSIKDVTSSQPSRPGSTSSRASRALSFFSMGKKVSKETATTEWQERKQESISIS